MKSESTIPTIPVRVQAAAYAAVGRGPAVAPDFGDAAPPYRAAPDVAAGPAAPPVGAAPMRSLDIRALQHPAEDSRLLLALSASAVVFGFAAMAVYAIVGWTVLVEYAAYIAAFGVVVWVSLQIYRSRLLGGAVRVTETTLPELQSVFDEVRARLNYHKPVDVYVMDKVDGGSSMTSYLGTRLIRIEGGLAADLLGDEHRAELRFMIGRHIGQLKARHQRLLPIMLAISLVDSLKFLQLFLAPYYRATAKSGDQIAAACSGDIQATAGMMNRLLVGKELGPRLVVKGVLDQAAIVKRRWLPRLAQLFQSEPHATNRYLNLLAFFARVAPEEIGRWRASLDEDTASRLTAAINASAHKRAPRHRMSPVALLVATLITGGLLALSGWGIFSAAQAAKAAAGQSGAANTQAGGQANAGSQQPGGGTGSQAANGASSQPANGASSQPANGASSQPGGGTGSAQPASGITATLAAYFNAINARNYQVAWSELSAANQAANPYAQFAAGESSTTIQNVYLHGTAAGSQPGTYVAEITFRSHQDPSQAPNHSDSCDDWTLDYTMIQSSGRWLIDSANAAPGVPEYQSCG
jgi:hypothetical protein